MHAWAAKDDLYFWFVLIVFLSANRPWYLWWRTIRMKKVVQHTPTILLHIQVVCTWYDMKKSRWRYMLVSETNNRCLKSIRVLEWGKWVRLRVEVISGQPNRFSLAHLFYNSLLAVCISCHLQLRWICHSLHLFPLQEHLVGGSENYSSLSTEVLVLYERNGIE